MAPLHTAAIFYLLILLAITTTTTTATTHNITKLLAKHPDLSTFNEYLTKTHLATEINRRQTITVLALDNSAMSSLLSKGFSLYTLRNVLSLHVLVDYFGAHKLHQVTDGSTLTASLFQSSGEAVGNSGYVNITDMHGGKVGFAPSDADGLHAFFVKSIVEMPYRISVIQISHNLDSDQAEAPTPEPSKVDLMSLLADKGCKAFSHLLSDNGVDKTFQDNIDSGLTVFCVGDNVVNSFMPKYKNLTKSGKQSILLYHGIPLYNSLPMFKSNNGAMTTLATNGNNKYDITVQNDGETVTLETTVVTATITGTLFDDDPLVCYKIDKFLQPRQLFKGAKADKPSPAPDADSPTADSPDDDDSSDDDVADDTSHKSKHNKNGAAGEEIYGGGFVFSIIGGLVYYGVLALL